MLTLVLVWLVVNVFSTIFLILGALFWALGGLRPVRKRQFCCYVKTSTKMGPTQLEYWWRLPRPFWGSKRPKREKSHFWRRFWPFWAPGTAGTNRLSFSCLLFSDFLTLVSLSILKKERVCFSALSLPSPPTLPQFAVQLKVQMKKASILCLELPSIQQPPSTPTTLKGPRWSRERYYLKDVWLKKTCKRLNKAAPYLASRILGYHRGPPIIIPTAHIRGGSRKKANYFQIWLYLASF